ncbi:hypothetical protein HORM4_440116 [Vibrio harveyi]|nr:hypothetical protein HORM4_440116 [Vibrio harveyi]
MPNPFLFLSDGLWNRFTRILLKFSTAIFNQIQRLSWRLAAGLIRVCYLSYSVVISK